MFPTFYIYTYDKHLCTFKIYIDYYHTVFLEYDAIKLKKKNMYRKKSLLLKPMSSKTEKKKKLRVKYVT